MNNLKKYTVTVIGMCILTIYCLSRLFEIDIEYLFHITIFSLTSCLLIKLIYWYNIKKNSEKENFLRLSFVVLTYILPLYMIIQEYSLIIDIVILKLSLLIIFIFSIIGMLIEKYLFYTESKNLENL